MKTQLAAILLVTVASVALANDPVIFDNGVIPNTGLSSQLDTAYAGTGFESQVADDFLLKGAPGSSYDVTGIDFTGLQFNDPPDLPNPVPFNIYFYSDNGMGTGPVYTGNGTSSPAADAICAVSTVLNAPEPAPGPYSYMANFDNCKLDANTTYWVAVQAETNFPPQFGWHGNNNGGNAVQGFPFLGTPFWNTVSPGTEMDFQLRGFEQGQTWFEDGDAPEGIPEHQDTVGNGSLTFIEGSLDGINDHVDTYSITVTDRELFMASATATQAAEGLPNNMRMYFWTDPSGPAEGGNLIMANEDSPKFSPNQDPLLTDESTWPGALVNNPLSLKDDTSYLLSITYVDNDALDDMGIEVVNFPLDFEALHGQAAGSFTSWENPGGPPSVNYQITLQGVTFASPSSGADGDFNDDGVYDCFDIDALVAEIANGSNDPTFDLTNDGFVDLADRDSWLAEAGAENLASGNPYLLGDATLDGFVDGLDFIEWNSNKFTELAAWCSGDFNADGFIDGLDFIEWNTNKFTMADANAAVPEPTSTMILIWLGILFAYLRRPHRLAN